MQLPQRFLALAVMTAAVGLAPASSAARIPPIARQASAALTWSAPAKVTDSALNDVSCPGTTLCVAVGDGAAVWTTTAPADNSPAWVSHATRGDGFQSVSCPTTSFCAAGDFAEDVYTSAGPSFGSWRRTGLPWLVSGPSDLTGILGLSCVSARSCVAVDSAGAALVSRDPSGGRRHWQHYGLTPHGESLYAVSCPHGGPCVAVGDAGYVATTTNAAGGRRAWTVRRPVRAALLSVACASRHLCAATDVNGDVLTSTNPTRGTWRRTPVDRHHVLTGISCPTSSFCVAVDADGGVVTTTRPTGGGSAWTRTTMAAALNLEGISCPTTRLCVAVDGTGFAVAGRR